MSTEEKDFACNEIVESMIRVYGEQARLFEYGGLRTSQEQSLLEGGADPMDINNILGDESVDRSLVAPLESIQIFLNKTNGEHWHYITMGFCDLYSEAEDEDAAGYYCDFELTLRLKKYAEETPPCWPLQLIQNIAANYIFPTGNRFAEHQNFPLNGPIVKLPGVTNEVIFFVSDPELGLIETAAGEISMLQMVGVTLDEYEHIKQWQVDKFLKVLESKHPMHILDPYRLSILNDPKVKKIVDNGIKRDGSSYGTEFVDLLNIEKHNNMFIINIRSLSIPSILNAMETRPSFGRDFTLLGPEWGLVFTSEESSGAFIDDNNLFIELSPTAIKEIASMLRAERGTYKFPAIPNVELTVLSTEITNQKGEVVKTVG